MNRRFTVEEVENGWLLKVSELGSDRLVGRFVYLTMEAMINDLFDRLKTEKKP